MQDVRDIAVRKGTLQDVSVVLQDVRDVQDVRDIAGRAAAVSCCYRQDINLN